MTIPIAAVMACMATLMFWLLWRLTVDEAFGERFARLAGHRPLGDAGLDGSDALGRIASVQGVFLMTGVISATISILAIVQLLSAL